MSALLQAAQERVAREVYGDPKRRPTLCVVERESEAAVLELTGRVEAEVVREDGVRVVRERSIVRWRAPTLAELAVAVTSGALVDRSQR